MFRFVDLACNILDIIQQPDRTGKRFMLLSRPFCRDAA